VLKTLLISRPDKKTEALDSLDLEDFLFVTSDVESKFFWKNHFLQKAQGLVGGDKVLRASELWILLLKQQNPSWKIVDSGTLLFFLEKWMEEFSANLDVPVSSKDRQSAFDFLLQLMPVITHEQGHDGIRDWFDKKPEAAESWSHWYILSQFLWQHLRQKKIISDEFVSGVLAHEGLPNTIERPIVFDLSLQITATEVELLQALSRQQDIVVLVPRLALEDDLSSYHSLVAPESIPKVEDEVKASKDIRHLKLPSMLSEVKNCVAQVRLWLDSGTPLEHIAVASPVIENYWPTLSEYLEVEGIPVEKAIVAPLSQSMSIHQWLSALKISMDQGSNGDLRQHYFMGAKDKGLSFKVYQQNFKNYYGSEDLAREVSFAGKAPRPWNLEKSVSFSEFLEEALEYWPAGDLRSVDGWISDFDNVWTCQECLHPRKWLEYLQRFFARKEKRIQDGQPGGLKVQSLSGIENQPATHTIVLGLSQQSFKATKKTPLTMGEALSLKNLYGFYLDHGERGARHQQLQWVLQGPREKIHFYFAETDFSGGFQTPSLFWLKGAIAEGKLQMSTPMSARWDEVMSAPLQPRSAASQGWIEGFRKKLEGDLEGFDDFQIQIPNLSLSASMMEEYFKCPYRVLVQKGFGLRTVPSLDLDVDYQTRGVLLHKICELILEDGELSLDDEGLQKILDRAKEAEGVSVVEASFWPYFENFYRKIARAFVTFERDWREKFPETKTVAVESSVKGFISPKTENLLSAESSEGSFPFRGKIDRLDQNAKGDAVVIDYKTSKGPLLQFGSWFKKGLFQNILYILAVQEGLSEADAKSVRGAYYFVLRDMERKLGVHGFDDGDFLPPQKGKVDFDAFLKEGRELLRLQLEKIVGHHYPAQPIETSTCESCSWGPICRRSRVSS